MSKDKCQICGKPFEDHKLRCPECGYSACDAKYWGDHHLCSGKIPKENNQEGISDEHFNKLRNNIKQVMLLLNDLQRQYRALTGKNYVIGG